MRFRLLAFFPLAVGLALFFLVSASSFVSAVETAVDRKSQTEMLTWIPLSLIQSECDALYREIHALSHEVTRCGSDPLCLGSPILCPVALDPEVDREYARLRSELNERCGVPLNLMDYAWGGPAWGERSRDGAGAASASHARIGRQVERSSSDSERAPNQCGAAHDWLESASSGTSEVSQYFF